MAIDTVTTTFFLVRGHLVRAPEPSRQFIPAAKWEVPAHRCSCWPQPCARCFSLLITFRNQRGSAFLFRVGGVLWEITKRRRGLDRQVCVWGSEELLQFCLPKSFFFELICFYLDLIMRCQLICFYPELIMRCRRESAVQPLPSPTVPELLAAPKDITIPKRCLSSWNSFFINLFKDRKLRSEW